MIAEGVCCWLDCHTYSKFQPKCCLVQCSRWQCLASFEEGAADIVHASQALHVQLQLYAAG